MTNHGVDDRSSEKIANYRCVCGATVELGQQAVECASCGRQYDARFLHSVGADTVSIDADHSPARLASHPDNDPLIGQRLGHFKLLSRIGHGGVGAVYHALDESLQRYVALKVIHGGEGDPQDTDLERLFQEARAQARVNHPHVVHVYYVGMEDKTPFLAMELVASGTLADRMRAGTIAFQDVVRYATQLTRALACAAQYDIVHGDIKPSNVLLVDDKTVKLSDFGLARRLSESSQSSAKVSGTPDYMPPESTRGEAVDHQGDMYSLGVTLFQMTFGRLPYTISSDGDLTDRLRLHREAPVEFPENWPAELPEAWQFLLTRLLEKEPARRYADFSELESDLQKVTPINMPIANPAVRLLAWGIDCILLMVVMIVIQVAVFFVEATLFPGSQAGNGSQSGNSEIPQLGVLGSLLNSLIAAGFLSAIALLQAHWGSTTGKRFLHLTIVDQHGLKPRRRVLAARTAFQFSWAWWIVVSGPLAYVGMPSLAAALAWLVVIGLIAEISSVLLRGGRSIHDSLFGTRVVLDVSPDSHAND